MKEAIRVYLARKGSSLARKGYGMQSKGSFLVTLKESNTHKIGPITIGAASRVS